MKKRKMFDIFNNKERKIICTSKHDTMYIGESDYEKLEVGKTYTVTNVDVHGWYTMLTLAEFPDEEFNSVYFSEI